VVLRLRRRWRAAWPLRRPQDRAGTGRPVEREEALEDALSKFLTPLRIELVDEFDDIHELLTPLEYQSDLLGLITIPAGFRTDFASVPRIVGAYLMFGGKGKRAAVVHDFLYSGGLAVERDIADEVFREALHASSMVKDGKVVKSYSDFTIWMMYQGVRIGGAAHFNAPNVTQPPVVAAQMEAP
jgi:hypothetical protein